MELGCIWFGYGSVALRWGKPKSSPHFLNNFVWKFCPLFSPPPSSIHQSCIGLTGEQSRPGWAKTSSFLSHLCILTQNIPSLAGSHRLTFSRQQSPAVGEASGMSLRYGSWSSPAHSQGRKQVFASPPQLKAGYTGDTSANLASREMTVCLFSVSLFPEKLQ